MIQEELKKRKLPDVLQCSDGKRVVTQDLWSKRREEIGELLQREYCGYEPPLHPKVQGIVKVEDARTSFAGKAVYQQLEISCDIVTGNFSFPCHFVRPKAVDMPPVFVYISFSQALVDELIPVEELLDAGFAIVSFCYQDIAPDSEDNFINGIAAKYGRNPYDSWGKVRMWAWAASRIMDYLQTLDCIDKNRIAVVGHSRLGKTALVCGAFDERFSLTVSNDSGGAGAAIFRGKTGEMVKNFRSGTSGHWFDGNFKKYAKREEDMPFDQHFLLALVAPRNLYVCSAKEDAHADPTSEFLGCAAATPVYELLGKRGLVTPDRIPEESIVLLEGSIGYHMREGHHFLSRYDWLRFIEYRNMKEHIC